MPSIRCPHCEAFIHIPANENPEEKPVEVPPDVIEESDRQARAYGWEIGKGTPIAEVVTASEENPFIDPEWRDRYIHPSEG